MVIILMPAPPRPISLVLI